jgi:hypothetical protein
MRPLHRYVDHVSLLRCALCPPLVLIFEITGSKPPIHSLEDSSDGIGESEGGTISISQILSLKERFDRADTDGGGSLDLQEFMDAFGSIINKDGSMTGLFFLAYI